jgi:hypothetical protein
VEGEGAAVLLVLGVDGREGVGGGEVGRARAVVIFVGEVVGG